MIIVGTKSNQTNTAKLQELFEDQVQTPCESKNTFSVRTFRGLPNRKVDKFNLKKLKQHYLSLGEVKVPEGHASFNFT